MSARDLERAMRAIDGGACAVRSMAAVLGIDYSKMRQRVAEMKVERGDLTQGTPDELIEEIMIGQGWVYRDREELGLPRTLRKAMRYLDEELGIGTAILRSSKHMAAIVNCGFIGFELEQSRVYGAWIPNDSKPSTPVHLSVQEEFRSRTCQRCRRRFDQFEELWHQWLRPSNALYSACGDCYNDIAERGKDRCVQEHYGR